MEPPAPVRRTHFAEGQLAFGVGQEVFRKRAAMDTDWMVQALSPGASGISSAGAAQVSNGSVSSPRLDP